ncbi:MAG: hypothetical protein LBG74_03110 [Spirochaetaceae bacterium]|nr:hypothetical protein [Spirochaetaceae bacterium]
MDFSTDCLSANRGKTMTDGDNRIGWPARQHAQKTPPKAALPKNHRR